MVSRQQLGDIFLGITPKKIRDYMTTLLKDLHGEYDRLIIPCAGRFTIAEAAAAAGWPPQDMETSDVTLFSSVLGHAAAGTPFSDLGVKFHDEFDSLQQYCGAELEAGAILFGLKASQLRADKYFERVVLEAMWAEPETFIRQLQTRVDDFAQGLAGLEYKLADCRVHLEEHAGEPKTVLYVNPPGYSKGYTKMFDTGGRITWSDPAIHEFDAKIGREQIYTLVDGAKALALIFRSKEIEEGREASAVFAAEGPGRTDYVLSNRPDEVKTIALRRNETKLRASKLPFLPDDHEVTVESKINFVETDRATALYYRDLFAHKLGVTRAERYFLMMVDGYLCAVLGMFFSEVQRCVSGKVYETFGFCAPNARYPRINRLFMTAIVCEDARQAFQRCCQGSMVDVDYFQTTCISTTPEQKTHRGSIKLKHREVMPDGRYKLVYGGAFKPWGFDGVIEKWLARMRNVEKQTGRPMGVNLIPENDLVKEGHG